MSVLTDSQIEQMLSNVVVDSHSHALEEHPNSAPLVHECLNEKGAYMSFQIFPKERYLRICIVDEELGIIGFQIVDIVGKFAKERTAYIKEDLRCIKDVLNYVAKKGWTKFTGPL